MPVTHICDASLTVKAIRLKTVYGGMVLAHPGDVESGGPMVRLVDADGNVRHDKDGNRIRACRDNLLVDELTGREVVAGFDTFPGEIKRSRWFAYADDLVNGEPSYRAAHLREQGA